MRKIQQSITQYHRISEHRRMSSHYFRGSLHDKRFYTYCIATTDIYFHVIYIATIIQSLLFVLVLSVTLFSFFWCFLICFCHSSSKVIRIVFKCIVYLEGLCPVSHLLFMFSPFCLISACWKCSLHCSTQRVIVVSKCRLLLQS